MAELLDKLEIETDKNTRAKIGKAIANSYRDKYGHEAPLQDKMELTGHRLERVTVRVYRPHEWRALVSVLFKNLLKNDVPFYPSLVDEDHWEYLRTNKGEAIRVYASRAKTKLKRKRKNG